MIDQLGKTLTDNPLEVLNMDIFQTIYSFFSNFLNFEVDIKNQFIDTYQRLFKTFTTKLEDNIDHLNQGDAFSWRNALKANFFFTEWMVENYLTQSKAKKKEIKKAVKVNTNHYL